jgi:HK97 gp10 family phage protein
MANDPAIIFPLSELKKANIDLDKFQKKAKRNLRIAAVAGAATIRDAMKNTSAFVDRSGGLRGSIWADEQGSEDKSEISASFGAAKIYAAFLEFGTSRMSPHEFAQPAVMASNKKVREFFIAGYNKAVKQSRKKGL